MVLEYLCTQVIKGLEVLPLQDRLLQLALPLVKLAEDLLDLIDQIAKVHKVCGNRE